MSYQVRDLLHSRTRNGLHRLSRVMLLPQSAVYGRLLLSGMCGVMIMARASFLPIHVKASRFRWLHLQAIR